MKFEILSENISKAIASVARIIGTNSQLPILNNIYLKAEKTKVSLIGTNLETTIFFTVSAKIDKPGKALVPAKALAETASLMGARKTTFLTEEGILYIRYNKSEIRISLDKGDYPIEEKHLVGKEKKGGVSLVAAKLTKGLERVVFASANDVGRQELTGVFFQPGEKKKVELAATDGYRLALSSIEVAKGKLLNPCLVPSSAVRELIREKGIGAELYLVEDKASNQLFFIGEAYTMGVRLIEGSFPDYKKIVPGKGELVVEVGKDVFITALRQAAVFARDNANVIQLDIGKDLVVKVGAQSTGGGRFVIEGARITGKGMVVAFNFRFLLEALSVFPGDVVKIELASSMAPVKLVSPDEKGFLQVIMPVKL